MFYILISFSVFQFFSTILLFRRERHIVGGQKISLERMDHYFLNTVNSLHYRRAKLFHIYGIWGPCSFYSETLLPLVEASETTGEGNSPSVAWCYSKKNSYSGGHSFIQLHRKYRVPEGNCFRATRNTGRDKALCEAPVRKNFVQAYRFTHPGS